MNKFNIKKINHELTGCLIFFYDKSSKEPIGTEIPCNQTGVFISEQIIICSQNRKIRQLNINELSDTYVKIIALKDKTKSEKVSSFFKLAKSNYRLFKLGIRALSINNMKVFDEPFIMPKFIQYNSESDYQQNWNRVYSKLKKSDSVFTFNSKSLISKTISYIDKGSWSHTGIYAGNGEIIEAVSRGVVRRNILSYRNKHIHFGIYRTIKPIQNADELVEDFWSESNGLKYGFHKAIILGIRTILGLTEDKFSPTDVTPNALIYSGNFYLVDYV